MADMLADRIKAFNKNLLPNMVQIKYSAMVENIFRFYRGTCHLFYEDLSKAKPSLNFPKTWICGDLHMENFGSFKANNRMVYFDLNDFDESCLAFVNWEVLRVVTSIFVSFYFLKIKASEANEMARLFLGVYSQELSKGKAHYIDPRTAKGIVKDFLKAAKKRKEKDFTLKETDFKHSFNQIIIDNKTHFKLEKELKKALIQHLTNWIQNTRQWPNNYVIIDAAFRIAGTGSVGLKRYMFLLQSVKNKKKYLFVEMKEGVNSSLSPYNAVLQPKWSSEAERIISIKFRMQNISPALLNTTLFQGDDYVLQEMQPSADKINFALIENRYKGLKEVLTDMAILTASSQIRSGGMQGSATIDELILFGQRKDWQESLLDNAIKYSKQVKKDYDQFAVDYKNKLFTTA